jgi:hypothetical protein
VRFPKAVYGDFESRPYFQQKTLCTISGLIGRREIKNEMESQDLIKRMAQNYIQAIDKLPQREGLIVIGGVLKYYSSLIAKVLDEIKLPYKLNPNGDALDGLIQLLYLYQRCNIIKQTQHIVCSFIKTILFAMKTSNL